MKIITWNCNMAFRKKAELVLKYKPDIVIVPECEHPDKLKFGNNVQQPSDLLWFGNNQHKGIGIFSYSGYRFKLKKNYNPRLQLIIPISVKGEADEFDLYAIWAHNPLDPDGRYVEQIWKALHHYKRHLGSRPTILAGDFNSNTIWDRPKRIGNHSDVVKKLEKKGISSAYHLVHGQQQGKEKHPTLYMYRHKDKAYHIDYCFVSADLASRLHSVEIGSYKTWKPHSDHVPVIVTFN